MKISLQIDCAKRSILGTFGNGAEHTEYLFSVAMPLNLLENLSQPASSQSLTGTF